MTQSYRDSKESASCIYPKDGRNATFFLFTRGIKGMEITDENITTSNEELSSAVPEKKKRRRLTPEEKAEKERKRKLRLKAIAKKQAEEDKRIDYYNKQGVNPFTWKLYPMTLMHDDEVIYGFFTRLFVNSSELGAISLEVYDVCTNTVTIGAQMSLWQLKKAVMLLRDMKKHNKPLPLITVYVPIKMFMGETLKTAYSKFIEDLDPDLGRYLCFAFTTEIAFADPEDVKKAMSRVEEKGIRYALLSFGEEYYAPLRMTTLNLDFVYYAPEFASMLLRGEREANLMVKMARELGYKCVAQFWNGNEYETPEGFGAETYPADYKLMGAGYDLDDLLKANRRIRLKKQEKNKNANKRWIRIAKFVKTTSFA